jgi:polyferredoxin
VKRLITLLAALAAIASFIIFQDDTFIGMALFGIASCYAAVMVTVLIIQAGWQQDWLKKNETKSN